MAYATYTTFTARVGPRILAQLTAETGTTPTNSVITAHLAAASQEINIRIGNKYDVPITGPAEILLQLAKLEEDIALWLLWADYRAVGDQESAAAAAKVGYDAAIKILEEIKSGDLDLAGVTHRTTPTVATASNEGWQSNVVVYTPTTFRSF